MPPDQLDDDPIVQMNVRVRKSLRDRIDARRAQVRTSGGGQGISRDKWISNAVTYALDAPRHPTTNTQRRTAPPRPS